MELTYDNMMLKLRDLDHQFIESVNNYRATSEYYKAEFLKKENLGTWSKVKDFKEFYVDFKKYYRWNSFSYTTDLKEHYDRILEKNLFYKWNVPINEIEKCIQKINAERILFIPENIGIFLSILTLEVYNDLYVNLKLARIISNLDQFENKPSMRRVAKKKKMLDVLNDFNNYGRRKNDTKKKRISGFDKKLDSINETRLTAMQILGIETTENEQKDVAAKLKNGKPEQLFLNPLFELSLPAPDTYDYEKHVAFFPLLQLLLKDKVAGRFTLASKEKFIDEVDGYRTYTIYQKSRVEGILKL